MTAVVALNKLGMWRTLFAGWQLGTRLTTDPECQAVRDHREVTLMLRAEVNALVTVLVEKGIVSVDAWDAALEAEAHLLDKQLEQRFPGVTTSQTGLHINYPKVQARGWMKEWRW
jgi:anti-sigma factor ChrR (cupin superfamily)